MAQTFFTIDCKTNLHVGSGKANYGVIDNLVQRDPTYQYPTIHASSLKGGIKEFCHYKGFNQMMEVFGSNKDKITGKSIKDNTQTGEYKFFDAMLLCIPVRCDKRAYIHIICPNILEYLHDSLPANHSLKADLLSLKDIIVDNDAPNAIKGYCFDSSMDNAIIEDFDITVRFETTKSSLLTPTLKTLFKHDIVILQNRLFNRLTNDLHLPVIARNYLENGESKNLWYEQVVPRLSRFWSMTIHSESDVLLQPELFQDTIVQIGANGSVGYGYCSFSKIN